MPRDIYRIAIISPYPPPREKHVFGSGVSSYTKNLVEAFKNIYSRLEIHVVAERRKDLPKLYLDKGVVVHRVYDQSLLYVFQIFRELCRIRPRITHIQHEYFLYGGTIAAVFFPLLVFLSKLISSEVIVTIHGVIPLRLLDDNEFRKENGIKGISIILKIGILLVTKLIALLASKIVVHEEFLKKYLIDDYRVVPTKIFIIPHGVEDLKPLPKNEAKKKLGLNNKVVLLYFGYLTGYKGVKELLKAYREIATKIPNTVLIIAGGPHPRLARKPWYRLWIRSLIEKTSIIQREIRDLGKIVFIGYVPEDKIPLYFSAADIVILPYKARIAASGPEALALAFTNCSVIRTVNSTKDVHELASSIVKTVMNIEACRRRSNELKKLRLWSSVAKLYLKHYLGSSIKYNNTSKAKMILMIAPEYPPHNIGGGGVVVQNIAKKLSEKGYKVIVLAGYYRSKRLLSKPWTQKDGNVHVIWLPLIPTPKKLSYFYTVMPPNIYSAILLYKVIKRLSRLDSCIVHLHGYGHLLIDYAALLLRTRKKPYILTIHGIPRSPLYLGNVLLKIVYLMYTKAIGMRTLVNASRITTISKALAKEVIVYGAKAGQIIVIPNGIDLNYDNGIKPGRFRTKYNISPDKRVILCIGRLHPRKGFQYVIAAMPYVLKEEPNTVLVIIGDGPYREVLKALAKKLGIDRNIIFTGYVDEQTKKEALADADIVVIPSIVEPFGLVALEAMLMKKPIVASNIDGLKEILEPFNELFVNPRNVNEVASKIKIFLKDSELRDKVISQLQNRLQQFLWNNIVQKYIDTYDEALLM